MRKLIVTEFITLDGVMEAPHEWSFPFWTPEIAKFKKEELFNSDIQLLGRTTYEGFAEAWPTMQDEEGFADKMNSMPKVVVSTTLTIPKWNNSTIIKGNVIEEITKLKQQEGKDILIAGSAQLIQSLMPHDIIDNYQLLVYPIILGKGKHLFPDGIAPINLKLNETRSYDSGVVLLSYSKK
ncbi:MAG: bifunctional deaminase-reductase domain protein [Candidatus Doudnabacteria bacterium]|nr:bifunctional deaminase-reductase domain protein [Candidatus Doudnabacteria bacterium]